jgi:hypothetical protein
VPLGDAWRITVVSDSAFKRESETDALTTRGAIIGLSTVHSSSPGGALHVLEFYSRRQKRICRSTFAAELNSAVDAAEMGKLLNLTLTELYSKGATASYLAECMDKGRLLLPMELSIDAKSLFDSLAAHDTKLPLESSLIVLVLQLKEMLQVGVLTALYWVDTRDMLADALNKGTISRAMLLQLGDRGSWTLKHSCAKHTETTTTLVTMGMTI